MLTILLAMGTLVPGATAVQPAPAVEVSGGLECPADVFVITIDNAGEQAYTVEVTGSATASGAVGPNETVELAVSLPAESAENPPPFSLTVTGDAGFPETTFDGLFGCPQRVDLHVTTTSGTSVEEPFVCPGINLAETQHGVSDVSSSGAGFVYTSIDGFVGEDSFDYACFPSARQFGTVFVTVTAAPPGPTSPSPASPASPAQPVAASTTLAYTGASSGTTVAAWVGAALLIVGGLALVARRALRPANGRITR